MSTRILAAPLNTRQHSNVLKETLGQRVRRLRIAKWLGANELGRRMGKSPGYVSNLEADQYESPRGTTLQLIASALETTLDELLTDLETKKPTKEDRSARPNFDAAAELLLSRGEVTPAAIRVARSIAAAAPVDLDLLTWASVLRDVARQVPATKVISKAK